jgi:hypothetical protein
VSKLFQLLLLPHQYLLTKAHDKECTIVNQETVLTPQNTVTPQVTQPVYTENLENSFSTICTRDNDINDTTTDTAR